MKKILIVVLLGTYITACSTQKTAVVMEKGNPPAQISKVDSNQMQTPKDTSIVTQLIVDTIPTQPVVQPISQDSIVQHIAKEEKKIKVQQADNKSIYGHVNLRAVISNMAEYKDALQHMDSLQKYLANQYKMMVQEFQKKEAEYISDTTSLPMLQQMRQQELQSYKERIIYFEETSQQQLALEENKLMAPIYEKMQNAVKMVSDELHLLAVFDDSYLLYSAADATDITNDVIKKLR